MMTVGHIIDEMHRIRICREDLLKHRDKLDENRDDACRILETNPTDLNDLFSHTIDILTNLELLFKTKIQDIEVDI